MKRAPFELKRLILQNQLLVAALIIQTGIVIARSLNLYATGFMTSDEADYALRTILGLPYGDRIFFDYVVLAAFRAFQVNTVARFFIFYPFYVTFWSFAFIILSYKIVGQLTQNRTAGGFVIVTLPFAVTYSLLSVGFLTETPGLVLATGGIYCIIRYLKVSQKWYLSSVSSLLFIAATYTREPYLAFAILGIPLWIVIAKYRKDARFHALLYIIPFMFLFVLPASPLSLVVTGGAPIILQPNPITTTVTSSITVTVTSTTVATSTTVTTNTTSSHTVSTTNTITTSTTNTTTETVVGNRTSTTVTTVSIFTTTSLFTPPVSAHSEALSAALLFLSGLILGWNPILFAVGVAGFLILLVGTLQRKRDWFQLPLAIIGLSAFTVLAIQYANFVPYFSGQGVSALVRYANPSIIGYLFLAPVVYERLSKRAIKIIALALIVMTVLTFGAYTSVTQSQLGLSYNALSLDHPYGPFVAREYFVSNPATSPTLVYISWDWKAGQLYLIGLQNIIVYPTFQKLYVSEQQFVSARPSMFYVLSAGPLGRTANDSLAQLGLQQPPRFLVAVLDSLYGNPPPGSAAYVITPPHVIFNDSTGYLLEVNATWN